jgi:hypothetical protein
VYQAGNYIFADTTLAGEQDLRVGPSSQIDFVRDPSDHAGSYNTRFV